MTPCSAPRARHAPSGAFLGEIDEKERGVFAMGGIGFDLERFTIRADTRVFQDVNGSAVQDVIVSFLFAF